ncbi:MAG: hypothetical protein V1811_00610 [Candidatus Micrarchaeota archaeon]
MIFPQLAPHFITAFILAILLAAMVAEPNQDKRFLEALFVFFLFWASIIWYAWAHRTVSKPEANY